MRMLWPMIVSLTLAGCAEMAKKDALADAEAHCASEGKKFIQKEATLKEGLFISTASVTGWCGEKPTPYSSRLTISLPPGWEKKILLDSMVAGNGILYAVNRNIDAGMLLSASKREGITDLMEYSITRRADQTSKLIDSHESEIAQIDIQGKRAFRFDVTGTLKTGQKMTYMATIIEGSEEIAYLSTWTTATNYERQKESLSKIANDIVDRPGGAAQPVIPASPPRQATSDR